MLPLFLDLVGKRIVVFGGGEVGFRKASYFASEARVAVISLDFVKAFQNTQIELIRSDASSDPRPWIEGADFVVAATDDTELNGRICAIAIDLGKPCNRADGISSFIIPSTVQKRNFTIAISTMGNSPAMARFLSLRVQEGLPEGCEDMVDLQRDMRVIAKRRIGQQSERERLLRMILEDNMIWEELRLDKKKAMSLAMQKLEGSIGRNP